MIDIQNMLNKHHDISAWVIREKINRSLELFFVKDRLDMNRRADTHEFDISVYVDFEEQDTKYKGHADFTVGVSDTAEEIEEKIDSAVFSAKFVKNKWYDLPTNPSDFCEKKVAFSNIEDLKTKYGELQSIIYRDYGFTSRVNSCEIFGIEGTRRVITSKGTDLSYPYSEFTFEIVTDCDTGKEPVEIFNGYYLTHISTDQIEKIVKQQLMETEGRSRAVRNLKMENQRVILSGDAVEEFLSFYAEQATDSAIYNGVSLAKRGELFQSEQAAEKISIVMNPALSGSIDAKPVDHEGKILSSYPLFEDGAVKNIRTSARYSHYLGIENIGYCTTFEVRGGEHPLSDYLDQEYIEILAFSSFLTDFSTGDFGGEFRLAKHVKEGKITYLTGGAISENIIKIQNSMRFSKELQERRRSVAPKAIILDGITVSGENEC